MSKADNWTLIILAGLLVLAICLLVYFIFFKQPQDSGEFTVESGEDNPYLRQIGEFRDTFVKNLVVAFSVVWFCKEDELHISVQTTDWDNHLINLIYKNHIVRCYVDWKREKVRIAYTYQCSSFSRIKTKTFRLKNNSANYEEIQNWGIKTFTDILMGGSYTLDDLANESITDAKAILDNKENGEHEFKKMLVEVWENYVFHKAKDEIKNDLANFKKLTAYVMRYCPQELDEYIAEHNKAVK